METALSRIAKVSRERPKERFTSLVHLLNVENLAQCHHEIPANRATGVDQVTKGEYGQDLEENLEGLVDRMKRQSYKPQSVRRAYIPKDEHSVRPLGIPAYEDKIVQRAMSKILNAIYEPKFRDNSYGFRPRRNCHQALRVLDEQIMRGKTRYVVDADIEGFFNHVDHEWLMKCLEHRIADPNFLRLIHRFLKAGMVEEGVFEKTEEGTPQGGLISPILGNVYLHYVLDMWFELEIQGKLSRGKAHMVRYADDFVCCFERKEDAEAFYEALKERLAKFNLKVSEEKTKIIRFGKGSERGNGKDGGGKPGTFDFLGFRHYWGKGKNGRYRLMRKTAPKKFKLRIKEFGEWMRQHRHDPEEDLVQTVGRKLQGHYQFYGVSDNHKGISAFYNEVLKLIWKWRNRRSQKRSFTVEKFQLFLKRAGLPKPAIKVNLYSSRNS